ncbi:MAG TPA: AAA family ATPase, partial [Saprospiraceae bacterium]|nr:AAA family ATPase [Saprospiraceae bacterium]
MIKRNILSSIKETLTKYPIIALTGPRQSGKTTFLKNELSDFKYVNLEDPELRAFVNRDPNGFLESYPGKVIFDEAQHASALFSYLQVIVDDKREMGQFILSGSQNFQLMEKITQSLAGRVALFRLFPFDFSEMVGGEI